jgi:hypothetical protein
VRRSTPVILFVVASIALTACGGKPSGRSNPAKQRDPSAESVTADARDMSSSVPSPGSVDQSTAGGAVEPSVDMQMLGAASGFGGPSGDAIKVTINGRDCISDGLFGICRAATGAGGAFVVATITDHDDYAVATTTVYCGAAPAVPLTSVTARQLVSIADVTFDGYGEALGIVRYAGDESEAMIAYQPAGAACPSVFGLGPIKEESVMIGGNNTVGVTRPDDSLACITSDGAGGFAVSENQTKCPLG